MLRGPDRERDGVSSWRIKVACVSAAIRATSACLLYLLPYSPDLNLIEQAFAKLKELLRKATARTQEALWTTIGHLVCVFQ